MATGNYDGSLVIASKDISIRGEGATLTATAGSPAFDIQTGGHLHVHGLTIVNTGTANTINCSGADIATLDINSTTIESFGVPLLLQGCSATVNSSRVHCTKTTNRNIIAAPTTNLTIERSILDGGDGVMAEGQNTVVHINNSVILNMAGPEGAFVGSNMFGAGAGTVFVSFSTVIGSIVYCGSAAPRCAGGTAAGSCIDNSIVVDEGLNPSADIIRGSCAVNYTLAKPQTTVLAGANNTLGAAPMFKDANANDYHLQATSPAVDTADAASTNAVDYDGVARPQGARRDKGAFEYH